MSGPPHTPFKARTHRLIASRYPTVGIFDDIAASEADLRAAIELESMTNGRPQAVQQLQRIPAGGLVTGPGGSLVMAAFLHADPKGGRFSDHRLGAWYASTELATAIAETVYHHERRLRASAAGFPNRIQMRELLADLDGAYLDIRGLAGAHPELYHLSDYSKSQAFVASQRWPFGAEQALIYDSVRRAGGTNVCVFHPAAVGAPVVQADHFEYVWDASDDLSIMRLTSVPRP